MQSLSVLCSLSYWTLVPKSTTLAKWKAYNSFLHTTRENVHWKASLEKNLAHKLSVRTQNKKANQNEKEEEKEKDKGMQIPNLKAQYALF